MRRINRFGFNGDERNVGPSSCRNTDLVPQTLVEVTELMNSVNRKLEDCAVEWQAALSRKQWRILDSKTSVQTPWEQSLLARTYFTDKILDESFQKLLMNAKIFLENLNNFIASLKGEYSIPGKTKDAQNQCTNNINENSIGNLVTPLDLSLLEDDKLPCQSREKRRSMRLAKKFTNNVQKSFADLIKAKIDLDTKFLGFEAILNGSAHPPSEGTKCLCQICSNVLDSVIHDDGILENVAAAKPKISRITKIKSKRLMKSPTIWKRNSQKITNIKNSPQNL